MGPSSIDNRAPWLVEDSCLLTVIFFSLEDIKGDIAKMNALHLCFLIGLF